jgi:hypothetical protein
METIEIALLDDHVAPVHFELLSDNHRQLLSDDASYITGTALLADAGFIVNAEL